jgi:membrane protein implicated in regulation of membrane protease activity
MWVSEMKLFTWFKPKVFAAMLAVCAVIASVVAWFTGLNFWILAAIFVGALLVNGLIATFEDRDSSENQE